MKRIERMIVLTKINKASIAVNCDLIEFIEETPDTVITMTSNDKIVVTEKMSEVIEKVVQYKRLVLQLIESKYE